MGNLPPTTTDCYVITGASGTGKTLLLENLRTRGHRCFDETVRKTLTGQIAIGGHALPSKDPQSFVRELLRLSLLDLEDAQACGGLAFFDRGLPDLVVYARRFGVAQAEFEEAAAKRRYAKRVFILPPWREIFVNDDFRQASYDAYCSVHAMIERAYSDSGYDLVEVPKAAVDIRADFIERSIH
jgi:predicted ATPase